MPAFRLVKRLSPGLVVVDRAGNKTMWSQAKLRRSRPCARCSAVIRSGEMAFSSMTNTKYRYERLCLKCVGGLP